MGFVVVFLASLAAASTPSSHSPSTAPQSPASPASPPPPPPAPVPAQRQTRPQVKRDLRGFEILPGLRAGGSVRLRYELQDDFRFGTATAANAQDYALSQIRLHLHWQPSDSVSFFVEGQDANTYDAFRSTAINPEATPTTFADRFDIHQAYADLKLPVTPQVSLRIGRQKFNLGAQRLVASLEWVNTARVWDGVRVTTRFDKERTLDVIVSRVVPVNPGSLNNYASTSNRMFNSFFHALYYTDVALVPYTRVEAYTMVRHSSQDDDQIYTLGSRLAWKRGAWDADAEGMGQFGKYGGVTHSAGALHVGAGFKPGWRKTHIGVGYSFASGDGDPNDDKHTTFDNQYPLNHAYYGYMDFFAFQNMHNPEVVIRTTPWEHLRLRVAYHAFWLAQEDTDGWYNAGGQTRRQATTDVSPYVGSEVDFTVGLNLLRSRVAVDIGYSHFFAGSYVSNTGPAQDADFLFVQTSFRL